MIRVAPFAQDHDQGSTISRRWAGEESRHGSTRWPARQQEVCTAGVHSSRALLWVGRGGREWAQQQWVGTLAEGGHGGREGVE